MRSVYPDAFARLLEAALACADAEGEQAFDNAKARLIGSALNYADHHTEQPPRRLPPAPRAAEWLSRARAHEARTEAA